jgi:hypothetical protein
MNSPTTILRLSPLLALMGAGLTDTASAVTVSIGTQHFTDGQIVTSAAYNAAVTGQPAPFNAANGGDVSGPNFASAWTFNYPGPTPGTIVLATLTIGLWDGDTAASGSQVSLMDVDAIPFTPSADAVFEATQGIQGQYRIYVIPITPTAYTALEDGTASFVFNMQGPGLGVLGETTNNGAGLDFARLDITVVPEPSASLLAAGALLLTTTRRRRNALRA